MPVLRSPSAPPVSRKGDVESAVQFYDSILKDRPNDLDILNLKANALSDTNNHEFALQAEKIQDELVNQRPRDGKFRFNRALSRARVAKYQEAIADLGSAIDLDFLKRRKDMLTLPEFKVLREMPEFIELERKARESKQQADI